VPKDIEINWSCSERFIISFLERVAQLGHLESLKLGIGNYSDSTSVDVANALNHAVQANNNLHHFEIHDISFL
jgi:hypothetical protein